MFVRGLRELSDALLHAGAGGLPLGGWRVHRALPAAALALLLSFAVSQVVRVLTPPPDPSIHWFNYEVFDERWLVLLYWLGVASTVLVPLRFARCRFAPAPADASEGARAVARRVALAVGVYALWLGPPWNLALLERPMEWHELVHLGPLQALLVGKAPYVEAGTQYGPGLQILSLHYLERFGVSLLRFREFWLWTHFAGGLVLVAWMARLAPTLPLVAGLLTLRFFSPFHFFGAAGDGSYGFFFGWASCVRYAGAVHAVLALASVLAREREGSTPGERAFLFASGALWGLFVQVSQENLGCGVAGLGLLSAFAALAGVAPPRRLAQLLAVFGVGAAAAVLPLLALYAAAGELPAFLGRYFEIGSLVVRGYSGTPFTEPWHSSAGLLYRAVPVAGVALLAVAAFDGRAPRGRRVVLAGAAAAALACFAPALLRTAPSHILAACTGLCVLVAAGAAALRDPATSPAARVVCAAVLLPVLLAVRPADLGRLAGDLSGRVRSWAAAGAPAPEPGRVGYRYDGSAPYSVFSELPLDEFLDLARRIHERVDGRPVVIASAIGTRGHWYFFADLHPHPADPEPSMTVLNNRMRARYLARLELQGIPCVLSTRPVDTELAIFRAQPGEREEWLFETSEADFFLGCLREAPRLARRS